MQCAIGLRACRRPMRAAPGQRSFPLYERRRLSAGGFSETLDRDSEALVGRLLTCCRLAIGPSARSTFLGLRKKGGDKIADATKEQFPSQEKLPPEPSSTPVNATCYRFPSDPPKRFSTARDLLKSPI
jgi:hypothetical protein